jgi:multiple sugar transport system permease protein
MKSKRREAIFGWGILFPAMVILAILFIKPLLDLLTTSLTNQNLLRPDRLEFVGLGNYIQMFKNRDFWDSLKQSVIFTSSVTVCSIVISMLVALLMDMEFLLKRFLFALLLLPWVTSFMSSAFAFTLMYDYSYGVFNYIMSDVLHIAEAQNWLGQLNTAMFSVIVVSTWHFLPFSILVLSNALKQVPLELIESANMDGASGIQKFFFIKMPLMKSAIITLVIVRIAAAFKMFDSIFLLTKGGPGDATTTLPLWYYQMGFQAFRSGMGAAIGVVLVILVLIVYFILIKLFGEDAV